MPTNGICLTEQNGGHIVFIFFLNNFLIFFVALAETFHRCILLFFSVSFHNGKRKHSFQQCTKAGSC